MNDAANVYDPRNLILEAYRMEGLTLADCRTIFLDWALGLKPDQDPAKAAAALLTHYDDRPADHPMTIVLSDAVGGRAVPGRKGGAAGRRR